MSGETSGSFIVYGGEYWGITHTPPKKLGDMGAITGQNNSGKVEYTLTNSGRHIEISEMRVTLGNGRLVEVHSPNAVVKIVNNGESKIVQDEGIVSDTIRAAIEYVIGLGHISGDVNTLPGGLGQNGHNGVKGTYLPPEINPNGNREVKITYLLEEMLRVHGKIPPKPRKYFSLSDLI